MRTALRQADDIRMKRTVGSGLDDIKIWSRRTNGANRQQRNHMTFRPISECLGSRALSSQVDGEAMCVTFYSSFGMRFPPKKSATRYLA